MNRTTLSVLVIDIAWFFVIIFDMVIKPFFASKRATFQALSLEDIVRGYLSAGHRGDIEGGCPSAALLDEIARSSETVKTAYIEGQLAIIDDVAARLAPDDPPAARMKAMGVFALMVGTLQVSRA